MKSTKSSNSLSAFLAFRTTQRDSKPHAQAVITDIS